MIRAAAVSVAIAGCHVAPDVTSSCELSLFTEHLRVGARVSVDCSPDSEVFVQIGIWHDLNGPMLVRGGTVDCGSVVEIISDVDEYAPGYRLIHGVAISGDTLCAGEL